jgi:hypothetical protein
MARRVSLETVDLKGKPAKAVMTATEDIQAQTLRLPRTLWRKLRRLAALRDLSMLGLIRATLEREIAQASPKERSFLD